MHRYGGIHQAKVASEATTSGWVDRVDPGIPNHSQTFLDFARVPLIGLGVWSN